ncbi:MAG: ROK family protein [Acidobacteriota bacterium]|nr:ROK family protein [Acidobacteriota bacterium]
MGPVGGIEAGGTKFVCGAGTGPHDLIREEFPTEGPSETIRRVGAFFHRHASVRSIGIGSFGPLDLKKGWITTTPKLNWRQFDLTTAVREATGCAVILDTDVNAAALAEHRWGAARGLSNFLYLTVGTGIGGGGMMNGQLMHGLLHPELGHIRIPHDLAKDPFPGNCPSHGDCLEGLAAGSAITARWGSPSAELPPDHPAWELEAHYLALGLVNWICTLSPERIIIGGGVMRRSSLFKLIRTKVDTLLNGYLAAPEILPPELGEQAGVLGAIALAIQCTS